MIYLDNSATTFALPQVVEKMQLVLETEYGNPSSLHNFGMEAENLVKEARTAIAKTIKAKEKEIFFTSGGTESNNMALIGAAMAYKRSGNHILASPVEHASVNEPLKFLEKNGFEVEYLAVDSKGRVDLSDLKAKLRPETIILSVMAVNNEIGTIQPYAEAAAIAKKYNPGIIVHVDAIQGYGKIHMSAKDGFDLLSVSGHKIHGPKGSGFLYAKEGTKLIPIIHGGGQESGKRSGTENTPAICGLAVAAKEACDNIEENGAKMRALKEKLKEKIGGIEGVSFNGPEGEAQAPHILSVSVRGVRAEVLLHALEDKGIYVSAGSACSSNKPATSRTLLAIGLDRALLDSTVRLSFSRFTTEEEIDKTAEAFSEIVPMLNKYSRH